MALNYFICPIFIALILVPHAHATKLAEYYAREVLEALAAEEPADVALRRDLEGLDTSVKGEIHDILLKNPALRDAVAIAQRLQLQAVGEAYENHQSLFRDVTTEIENSFAELRDKSRGNHFSNRYVIEAAEARQMGVLDLRLLAKPENRDLRNKLASKVNFILDQADLLAGDYPNESAFRHWQEKLGSNLLNLTKQEIWRLLEQTSTTATGYQVLPLINGVWAKRALPLTRDLLAKFTLESHEPRLKILPFVPGGIPSEEEWVLRDRAGNLAVIINWTGKLIPLGDEGGGNAKYSLFAPNWSIADRELTEFDEAEWRSYLERRTFNSRYSEYETLRRQIRWLSPKLTFSQLQSHLRQLIAAIRSDRTSPERLLAQMGVARPSLEGLFFDLHWFGAETLPHLHLHHDVLLLQNDPPNSQVSRPISAFPGSSRENCRTKTQPERKMPPPFRFQKIHEDRPADLYELRGNYSDFEYARVASRGIDDQKGWRRFTPRRQGVPTLAMHSPKSLSVVGNELDLPAPQNFKLQDVVVQSGGGLLFPRVDYVLEKHPAGDYRIRFLSQTVNAFVAAAFAPVVSRVDPTHLPVVPAPRVLALSREFKLAGENFVSAALEARSGEPMTAGDLERVIRDGALYTYFPSSTAAPAKGLFADTTVFLNADGRFCYQCSQAGEVLLRSFRFVYSDTDLRFAPRRVFRRVGDKLRDELHVIIDVFRGDMWLGQFDSTPVSPDPRASRPGLKREREGLRERQDWIEQFNSNLDILIKDAGQLPGRPILDYEHSPFFELVPKLRRFSREYASEIDHPKELSKQVDYWRETFARDLRLLDKASDLGSDLARERRFRSLMEFHYLVRPALRLLVGEASAALDHVLACAAELE